MNKKCLPNSAGTSDSRTVNRRRECHQGCGDKSEVLGCCRHLAIQKFHVVVGVPDLGTRRKQVPTDKRCIKGEGLYNRLRFHSFPEILIKYNIHDFIEKESQKDKLVKVGSTGH